MRIASGLAQVARTIHYTQAVHKMANAATGLTLHAAPNDRWVLAFQRALLASRVSW